MLYPTNDLPPAPAYGIKHKTSGEYFISFLPGTRRLTWGRADRASTLSLQNAMQLALRLAERDGLPLLVEQLGEGAPLPPARRGVYSPR